MIYRKHRICTNPETLGRSIGTYKFDYETGMTVSELKIWANLPFSNVLREVPIQALWDRYCENNEEVLSAEQCREVMEELGYAC